MKLAVYPFASTGDIQQNLQAIQRGADQAARAGVRLLVFHECALCGYPPVEAHMTAITPEAVEAALHAVADCARRHGLYLAVGTVRYEAEHVFNSMVLFDCAGNRMGVYDKESLWGWDGENFARGCRPGIFEIDGIRLGFRICFDVRFPESFRAMYRRQVPLCFVTFSDTVPEQDPARYDRIRAFLMTRAMENVMTVVSVNSLSRYQTAPNAVFDPNGMVVSELPPQQEALLIYDYQVPEPGFGMRGRIANNRYFLDN